MRQAHCPFVRIFFVGPASPSLPERSALQQPYQHHVIIICEAGERIALCSQFCHVSEQNIIPAQASGTSHTSSISTAEDYFGVIRQSPLRPS